MSNPKILDFQNNLAGLGVAYSGPKDGTSNSQFGAAMMALESKLQAQTGQSMIGRIFDGKNVRMTVSEVMSKFPQKEAPKDPTIKDPKKPEDLAPSLPPDQIIKAFQSALGSGLPVVGKLYNGPVDGIYNEELVSAAKKIESVIGDRIKKPMAGIIWNDSKKQFNTTPEDIKSALNKLEQNNSVEPKKAELSKDQRILKLSKLLQDSDKEKFNSSTNINIYDQTK